MSSKLAGSKVTGVLRTRAFSAQAAHKHSEGHGALHRQPLKQTKLPNGLIIAAYENLSPVSRVGVYVRAGSRFEQPGQLGITHALRNSAGLTTQSSSVFGITRNVEYSGGHLVATSNREDIAYVLDNNRDDIGTNVRYLADTVTRPLFKHWELSDNVFRMQLDRTRLKQNPEARIIEAIHRASFRGGLSNSVYSPKYLIGKHENETMLSYINDNYLSGRMAVIGLGVELDALVEAVEKYFTPNNGSAAKPTPSKFLAGDVRIATNSNLTYTAIVAEGAGYNNQKEALGLSLLQSLLGTGPRIKYSNGASPLSIAASKATKSPVAVSSLNISYSDTGLFGIVVAGSADDQTAISKAVVSKMREVAKSVKEADLQRAKQQLKASTLMSLESQNGLIDELGRQALNDGQVQSADEIAAAIDSVSLQDLNNVTSRVLKGKVAIASVGKLHNVPYMDDLV